MNLIDALNEYKAEVDLWKAHADGIAMWEAVGYTHEAAIQSYREQGAPTFGNNRAMMGANPAPDMPYDWTAATHGVAEKIGGLRLMFGEAVAHAVEDPIARVQDMMGTVLLEREEAVRMLTVERIMHEGLDELREGFVDWFLRKYNVSHKPVRAKS